MGASGLSLSTLPRGCRGTILSRCLKLGAKAPWNRVRFNLGLATSGAIGIARVGADRDAVSESGDDCRLHAGRIPGMTDYFFESSGS